MKDAQGRLTELRQSLDQLDSDLIGLLGRRFRVIRAVAELKRDTGLAVMQKGRVGEVFATRMKLAAKAGISEKLVESLWTTIISHACQVENEVGQISGGELLFQGTGLDHALVEVQDAAAAAHELGEKLGFACISHTLDSAPAASDARLCVLKGGDVTIILRESTARLTSPAQVAIRVHTLGAVIKDLRSRDVTLDIHPSRKGSARLATASLGEPAWIKVLFVERPLRTDLSVEDFQADFDIETPELCGSK